MNRITFSNLPPDARSVKAQGLIRDCRRDVPRLSRRLPLAIGTSRRLWQSLLFLAQIFSDNYNEDDDGNFSAGEECEQCIECFRAWIGLLATCDLPIPERQMTDETRKICADIMLQRLIFMFEHIRKEGFSPKVETPLRDLETLKHGLLRNLWAGVRRQEKLAGLKPARRIDVVCEIKKLEYELATLHYDTPEFADWENRYQNVLEQAGRLTANPPGAEPQPVVRAESESVESAAYVRQSPWQIRARLRPTVRFENVRDGETKTAGMAVLAYRAELAGADSDGSVVQKVLERKISGISRFSPER